MTGYFIRRIFGVIPILIVIITINFFMGHAAPGDPITKMYQRDQVAATEEDLERARAKFGLDRPLHVQYLDYMFNLARGDFGKSILRGQPVLQMILDVLPVSLQLGAGASLLTLLVGIPLGILAALRQNTWIDYMAVGGSLFLNSVPVFVLAPMLLILLVIEVPIMPRVPYGWNGLFSYQAILPVILMATGPTAVVIRQMRAGMLDVLSEDYVRTAKAKGLPTHAIIWQHVMRNALAPVVTSMGFLMMSLLTGSLFVDIIFGIPGFGRLTVNSVLTQDYPLLLGCAFFSALLVIGINLLVDLLYPLLDARVVYSKPSK